MSVATVSYGGGVQSTALLVLAAQGRIEHHTLDAGDGGQGVEGTEGDRAVDARPPGPLLVLSTRPLMTTRG